MLAGLALVSFLVTFALVRVALSRFGRFALDRPNARSLHERPVPRTGGLALLAGAAASLAFGGVQIWLPLLLSLLLAVLSFVDDVRGMPRAARLAAHLAAAGLLAWYLLSPMHPAELVVLALAVAWITNLYNFMDGSDGLAAGMTVIGFAAYGAAAHAAGEMPLTAVCIAIAAAAAAFLAHNFHPARIFLGDVGSIPLGFLAGALGLLGWRDDVWPLWFPVLVFAPFIADASVTLLRRVARRERIWEPHRDHYYQRLVRIGWGHRGAAWLGYALMAACALAALAGRDQPPQLQLAAFAGASALLAGFAVWVDLRWARHQRESHAAGSET